jgi:hypothetical protein
MLRPKKNRQTNENEGKRERKNVRAGELDFRQVGTAQCEVVAELRQGLRRFKMAEMRPPERM